MQTIFKFNVTLADNKVKVATNCIKQGGAGGAINLDLKKKDGNCYKYHHERAHWFCQNRLAICLTTAYPPVKLFTLLQFMGIAIKGINL